MQSKKKNAKHAMSTEPTPYRAQQEKSNPLWKEELMLFLTKKRQEAINSIDDLNFRMRTCNNMVDKLTILMHVQANKFMKCSDTIRGGCKQISCCKDLNVKCKTN